MVRFEATSEDTLTERIGAAFASESLANTMTDKNPGDWKHIVDTEHVMRDFRLGMLKAF